ncbi:hypothetical protein [Massilibacteroides vaginae]|uniref:hypothetical protein n=1 Tax=Massilibacteroides vaginae TaxID=1673718 RepID=UPI000A1CC33C|nr:hypothetical protein [Massilibacteroides vaginae]
MRRLIWGFSVFFCTNVFAQIYIPNGTSGVLKSTTDKVGIGKSNPSALFEVYSTNAPSAMIGGPNGRIQIGVSTSNGSYAPYAKNGNSILRVLGGINEEKGMLFHIANDLGDGRSYFKFGDDKNGAWFSLYNNKKVIINGLVGIGTSNPSMALEVNGKIRAKEIIVESGWADFVFSDEYRLPSLYEVKKHIKEHKHLPGIPTESEIKETGANLGEIVVKLLQKVEELTLYSIQQQEIIDKSIINRNIE